jgi:hypothetical protein
MKKILIVGLLLVLVFRFSSAQERSWEPVKIIGLYSASIVLNAVGDGLNDNGVKDWGHICNALSIGTLLITPFVIDYDKKKWWMYMLSYTSLRISIFDYTYNITRDLPLNYSGESNLWDRTVGGLPPLHRGVALIFGVSIPINNLK